MWPTYGPFADCTGAAARTTTARCRRLLLTAALGAGLNAHADARSAAMATFKRHTMV